MQSVGHIIDRVCSLIGKTDANTKATCKKFLRSRARMIYDEELWRDALLTYSVATTDRKLIMPERVQRVCGVFTDSHMVSASDILLETNIVPDDVSNSGTVLRYMNLHPVGCNEMSQNEALRFVSESGDTATDITVFGEDANGVQRKETVTMNATSNVDTSITWAQNKVFYISRDYDSTYTVTVTGATSGDSLGVLYPYQEDIRRQQIQLLPKPDNSETMNIICKRKWYDIVDDSDSVFLQSVSGALEAFTKHDMYNWMRMGGDAQLALQEASALMAQAKKEHIWQRGGRITFTPEPYGDVDGMTGFRDRFLRG